MDPQNQTGDTGGTAEAGAAGDSQDITAPIILDADTGTDDALAIGLLMAYAPERLVSVVATYGNVIQSVAQQNARDVLNLLGGSKIPVLDGCRCPSWAEGFAADKACAHFHGDNGIADLNIDDYARMETTAGGTASVLYNGAVYDFSSNNIDFTAAGTVSAGMFGENHKEAKKKQQRQASWQDEALSVQSAQPDVCAKLSSPIISIGGYLPKQPVDNSVPQRGRNTLGALADEYGKVEMGVMPGDTAGVKAIIDGVRQWGKNLTVISTGPLTDIAAAIALAPDIAPQLRLVMMGGALTQQGNCFDMVSETNIMQDPESANLVLRSQADVTMIGLDVTHRCLLPSELTEPWSQIDGGVGRFFADLASFMIKANKEADPAFSVGAPMHDPLAVAAALDPTLVQTLDIALRVDLATGDRQGVRGRTIGDMTRLNDPTASCTHVAIAVDSMRFLNMFTGGISALSQRLAQ
ncbi:nucleoside hydrolase [Bifidobacterium thermacidophilum]|uniref:Nucleoside hydrolase n=1 Tax=Bifidobacterium thermacidophilum TaxID=246618 RepID=A0ABW8KNR8_9BIFI